MGKTLLIVAVIGLVCSLILLLIIAFKRKILNIQKIWSTALLGDKLSISYVLLILSSFFIAVISVILIRIGV